MRCFLVILFLFALCTENKGQITNYFLPIDIKKGLSQNSVTCFFEDSDGLIWIGTQNGLNCFDGKNIFTYKYNSNDTSSLSHGYILKINQTAQGLIIVGTARGINIIDKRTKKVNRFYTDLDERQKGGYAHVSFTNDQNNFWLCTTNQVNLFDTKSQKKLRTIHFQDTFSLACLHKNLHFGVSHNHQLYLNNLQNKKKDYLGEFKIDTKQLAAYRICANDSFLALYNPITKQISIYNYLSKRLIQNITCTKKVFQLYLHRNRLFVSCDNGVMIVEQNFKQSYTIQHNPENPYSIPPGNVLCSFVDNNNNLWLGTSSAGVALNKPSMNAIHLVKNKNKADGIQAIYAEEKKQYVAASSGLYIYKNGQAQLLFSYAGSRINAVVTQDHLIYIGAEHKGLLVLDENGNLKKIYTKENSVLKSNQILVLTKDSRNNIFIGTENGLYRIAEQKILEIPIKDKNHYGYVLHIYEDANKQYWVSTNSGIVILDNNFKLISRLPSFNPSTIFKNTIISSVAQDTQGRYWVSTMQSGIFMLDQQNKWLHFGEKEGLNNEVCYKLVCDNQNRIWTITDAGVHVLKDHHFTQLNEYDGIPTSYYTFGSLQTDQNNDILIGCYDALLHIQTQQFSTAQMQLRAGLNNILVNNKSLENYSPPFSLNAHNKDVSFEFRTNKQTQFNAVFYQYQLAQGAWTTLPVNVSKINYSELPFGRFTLKLKAANTPSALALAPVSEFTFYNAAPYYKTIWFYALLFLLAVAIVLYINHLYHRRKTEKLNQIIAFQNELQTQRQQISKDLHDNIGAYTSALIAQIQQSKTAEDFDKRHADIQESANQIMLNLRTNIWILSSEHITIQSFSDRVKQYGLKMKQFYTGVNITFKDVISNDVELEPHVTINLFRIIQEALQNAFKHASASELKISMLSHDHIVIQIEDNGKGFSTSDKADAYGLSNMKSRAEEIQYHFSITSTSSGTLVQLQSQPVATKNTSNAVS